jgi:hypothetical protein
MADERFGVVWETWALEVAVIPAKAGTYPPSLWKCVMDGLDSRFRGNDRRFERDPILNDTNTEGRQVAIRFALTEIANWTIIYTHQEGRDV